MFAALGQPAVITAVTFRPRVGKLMSYYWATTRDSVRPDAILDAIKESADRGIDPAAEEQPGTRRTPPATTAR